MQITLRGLTKDDLDLLLIWAHIREIWALMPTSRRDENLAWGEHLNWWQSRKNRCDYMILADGESVGVIHAKQLDGLPQVGIYIAKKEYWNQGVAREALSQLLLRLLYHGFYRRLQAVIHPDNVASIKLFQGAKFFKTGEVRKEVEVYEYNHGTTY